MKKDFLLKKWYDLDLEDFNYYKLEKDYIRALTWMKPNIKYEVIVTTFCKDPALDILYYKELFFTESISIDIIDEEVSQLLYEVNNNIMKLNNYDLKDNTCHFFIKKISKSK